VFGGTDRLNYILAVPLTSTSCLKITEECLFRVMPAPPISWVGNNLALKSAEIIPLLRALSGKYQDGTLVWSMAAEEITKHISIVAWFS